MMHDDLNDQFLASFSYISYCFVFYIVMAQDYLYLFLLLLFPSIYVDFCKTFILDVYGNEIFSCLLNYVLSAYLLQILFS